MPKVLDQNGRHSIAFSLIMNLSILFKNFFLVFQQLFLILQFFIFMLSWPLFFLNINSMFGKTIPPISFHFILFQTIQLSNLTNHSIPFYFFSTIFFNSKSLYNIFKSQPFIPPRNSQSQTIQHIFFFKPFCPSQRMEWDGQYSPI